LALASRRRKDRPRPDQAAKAALSLLAQPTGLVTQIGHGNKWRGGKNVYVNKNFVVVRPVRGWKYRNYYDQASLSERSWA
jgi:hypothetical protein